MIAVAHPEECKTPPSRKTLASPNAQQAEVVRKIVPVIPLMSKEEGERLISQMPKRSLAEALEMMQTVLGRPMPLVEGGTKK